MGFSEQVKKFADKAKQELSLAQDQATKNMENKLAEVLGEDVGKITGGSFDVGTGKLSGVQAPPDVIERLRAADLLRD